MSVSVADLGLDFEYSTQNIAIIAVSSFVFIWFFSLKQLFGSYSIFHIMDQYKKHKIHQDKYNRLFETRDNLCYHIGWARSRGESSSDMKEMIAELRSVEKSIDEMEEKIFKYSKPKSDC